jgi:hypothetical protein
MRPLKGWAVVDSWGEIDCWDERIPIYWLKRIADSDARERSIEASVVRVEIRAAKKARKKR